LLVDVDEHDHAIIIQFSGVARAVAVSEHVLRLALHIVNIDFELN